MVGRRWSIGGGAMGGPWSGGERQPRWLQAIGRPPGRRLVGGRRDRWWCGDGRAVVGRRSGSSGSPGAWLQTTGRPRQSGRSSTRACSHGRIARRTPRPRAPLAPSPSQPLATTTMGAPSPRAAAFHAASSALHAGVGGACCSPTKIGIRGQRRSPVLCCVVGLRARSRILRVMMLNQRGVFSVDPTCSHYTRAVDLNAPCTANRLHHSFGLRDRRYRNRKGVPMTQVVLVAQWRTRYLPESAHVCTHLHVSACV